MVIQLLVAIRVQELHRTSHKTILVQGNQIFQIPVRTVHTHLHEAVIPDRQVQEAAVQEAVVDRLDRQGLLRVHIHAHEDVS